MKRRSLVIVTMVVLLLAVSIVFPYLKRKKDKEIEQLLDFKQFLIEYEKTTPQIEDPPYVHEIITDGRLIVNGVDITDGNYVRINHREKNAEIPILAILCALGYDAQMRYNEERDNYEAVINGEIYYSTATENYGIPFRIGEKGCVRKIENNDFIVDANCFTSRMYWAFLADLTVDYATSTIYVDSCDPWA